MELSRPDSAQTKVSIYLLSEFMNQIAYFVNVIFGIHDRHVECIRFCLVEKIEK